MDRGELYTALAKTQIAYDHQFALRVALESLSSADSDLKKRAFEIQNLLTDVKCILEQEAFQRIKSDGK